VGATGFGATDTFGFSDPNDNNHIFVMPLGFDFRCGSAVRKLFP